MNLVQYIAAGGKGSGCNPQAGKCGRHPGAGKHIEEGDRVIVSVPVASHRPGRHFPIGHEATVLSISPKIGKMPAKANIQLSQHKLDTARVKLSNLLLLKKNAVNTPKINVKPVGKSKIITRTKTRDGASYTQVKPTTAEDTRGKNKPHGLKGKFKEITSQMKVYTDPNTRAQIFFAQPRAAFQNQDRLQGTTVWVYRHYDTRKSVVREINTGQYGHSFLGSRTWTYKNMGSASGFLNKRYGIRQSLPREI